MEQAEIKKIENVEKLEKPKTFKARAYFLTVWENVEICTEKPNLLYGCKCEDVSPKTGRYHNHLFLYFKNPISFTTIQNRYGKEIHSKNIYSNSGCIDYILNPEHKKGNTKYNRQEYGTKPMDSGCTRCRAKDAINYTDEQILDLAPREAACVMNLKEKFKCTDLNTKTTRKNMNVVFICGPSDIGKSRRALDLVDELEPTGNYAAVKYDGHFWHGVKNSKSKTCIYDEWRDSKMTPDDFINFIDYNKHPINAKGAEVINNFENIIITSTQHPYFIYKNSKEQPKQWFKRMKIWNLYDENNNEHKKLFKKNNGALIEELTELTKEDKEKLCWHDY